MHAYVWVEADYKSRGSPRIRFRIHDLRCDAHMFDFHCLYIYFFISLGILNLIPSDECIVLVWWFRNLNAESSGALLGERPFTQTLCLGCRS